MKRQGSVTIFLSLLMAVFLMFIQVAFSSLRIEGGRIQAEAGVEEGLYSVFAGYDRELFEKYHVFFLDGGYGTGNFLPGKMYRTVENRLKVSLNPGKISTGIRGENLWKCSKGPGAITGYTLATDQEGRAFYTQAVDYMKETAGIQGIQLLMKQADTENFILKEQEKTGTGTDWEEAEKLYEQAKQQKQQEEVSNHENNSTNLDQSEESKVEVPPGFVNPLEIISQIRKVGLLALVLPPGAEPSGLTISKSDVVSERSLQRGMSILFSGEEQNTVTGRLLFQEYMMKHLNCYTDQTSVGGLSYQLEYAAAGKKSDEENLKAVVRRLLVIREGANMLCLLKNPGMQTQIHEMALVICTAAGLPALEGVVSLALEAAWAFGESVMDVRQMLQGGGVPLVKSSANWTLTLENLSKLPQLLSQNQRIQKEGLQYKDYLRILIGTVGCGKQVMRTMDVIEAALRQEIHHEEFRFDHCVCYLEVEMEVVCNEKQFTIQRNYGYEM